MPSLFQAQAFSAGVLVCPDGLQDEYLPAVPEPVTRHSVTRIGDAGLLYVSSNPAERGIHKTVSVHRTYEPLDPPPGWDDAWTLTTPAPLAVFDLTGRRYGFATTQAGTYLCRSRMISGSEQPGDPFFTPEGWVLEVTLLDPSTGVPIPQLWWYVPEDSPFLEWRLLD